MKLIERKNKTGIETECWKQIWIKWITICDKLVNETNLKWCSCEWKIIDKIQYSEVK